MHQDTTPAPRGRQGDRWQQLSRRQWAVVRSHLVAPWPREAIEVDVEWLRQQIEFDGFDRPSNAELAALWGTSRRSAGRFLDAALAPEACPRVPTSAQPCPTLPNLAHFGEDETALSGAFAQGCPDLPRLAQGCPTVPAGPLLSSLEVHSPPDKKEEGRTYVQDPSPPADRAPAKHPRKKASNALPEPVQRVWSYYRTLHPRTGEAPPKTWGVQAAVDELGEQAVVDLIKWAHEAPDQRAEYLRAGGYLGETLFRAGKRATYAEAAARWAEGARAVERARAEQEALEARPPWERGAWWERLSDFEQDFERRVWLAGGGGR